MMNDGNLSITINGERYYHISEVAQRCKRSVSSLRYLCLKAARGREKLRCYREGPRIYIPVDEITSYQFYDGTKSYHYIESESEPGFYEKKYDEIVPETEEATATV